jgi:hypothetical protein
VIHIPTTVYGQGYGPFNKLSLQLVFILCVSRIAVLINLKDSIQNTHGHS